MRRPSKGFTLIELVVVITIIGLVAGLLGVRTGTFQFWREEGAIREITELFEFLHRQAVSDQAFYELEIDLDKGSYRAGILRPESDISGIGAEDSLSDIGNLTRELNDFQNPVTGDSQTLIPPPSYPSLLEWKHLPGGVQFQDIKVSSEDFVQGQGKTARVSFSPRGFSEFTVMHLQLSAGAPITIFPNPYTGEAQIFRMYKEFEWKPRKNVS